jgi:hypothetical protein
VLYDEQVPDGRIEIRKLSTAEQIQFFEGGGQSEDRVERLLRSSVRLPSGFKHADLLVTDRLFLLLSLRTLTYGDSYLFSWRCQMCAKHSQANIEILRDLDEKVADETLIEPFDVELSDEDCTVQCRFLRGRDETEAIRAARRTQARTRTNGVGASVGLSGPDEITDLERYKLMIVSRSGEPFRNAVEKDVFLTHLTAADFVRLQNRVSERETGIDMTLYLDCPRCGADNETRMPFTAEFFRPSRL